MAQWHAKVHTLLAIPAPLWQPRGCQGGRYVPMQPACPATAQALQLTLK